MAFFVSMFLFAWHRWFGVLVLLTMNLVWRRTMAGPLHSLSTDLLGWKDIPNGLPPASRTALETSPMLKILMTTSILVDQVPEDQVARERRHVARLISLMNAHLKEAPLRDFYFELSLVQVHTVPHSVIQPHDVSLYDTAQTWFRTRKTTASDVAFVFSKHNPLQDDRGLNQPMAWTALRSVCGPHGSGLLASYATMPSTMFVRLFMHELLHTFGCPHDEKFNRPDCEGYLMASDMLSVRVPKYSPCTQDIMAKLIRNATCVKPTVAFMPKE